MQIVARILRAARAGHRRLRSAVLVAWYRALYPGLRVGAGVRLGRGVHISVVRGATLTIAQNVEIEQYCQLIVEGTLTIGAGSFIGTGSIIAAAENVAIGRESLVAAYVTIRDQDHRVGDPSTPYARQGLVTSTVDIGDNVWIGTKATVLRGVTVGAGAIIGAHALVRSDVAQGAVVGGVPAEELKIRSRRSPTQEPG